MTPETYFLAMVVGLPLVLLLIALIGGYFNRDGNERILDWKPTRSVNREVAIQSSELQQMLSAVNRYRRMRGAGDCALEEILEADRPIREP